MTELREAKIRVVLDLPKEGEPKPGEKRDGKKDDGTPPAPGTGGGIERRAAIREMRFGQLGRALRSALASIPFVGGAGVVGLELNERFGPGAESFIRAIVNEQLENAGLPIRLPDVTVLADMAKSWSDIKAKVSSFSAAVDRTGGLIAANLAGGGTISLEMSAKLFELERKMAEFEVSVLKDRRRIRQVKVGEQLGEAISAEFEKRARDVGK